MKKITTLLLLSCLTLLSFSQNIFNKKGSTVTDKGKEYYKIKGEVIGLQDSTVILAYYFGGKQYATDTADVINGKFTFEGNKELKGGMYLVVLSESRYFDIIVSEKTFSFSTKLDNLVGEMTFEKSKENPPFYEYLKFITSMQQEINPIKQKLQNADGIAKKQLEKKAQEIDNRVKLYRSEFLKNNSDIKKIVNSF